MANPLPVKPVFINKNVPWHIVSVGIGSQSVFHDHALELDRVSQRMPWRIIPVCKLHPPGSAVILSPDHLRIKGKTQMFSQLAQIIHDPDPTKLVKALDDVYWSRIVRMLLP
eukprot:1982154-Amphidinium_carterae.1